MKLIMKGKNIDVTDALRDHAEQKVIKIEKLGLDVQEVEVKLGVEKNPSIKENQIAEVMVIGDGLMLRAKDRDRDMYVAIDKAVNKLQRQIKKLHGKRIDRTQHGQSATRRPVSSQSEVTGEMPAIVKTKSIPLKPMTPEEATLQMEMLGHDFFVFTNADTDHASVVYRRDDGNFGLIETSR